MCQSMAVMLLVNPSKAFLGQWISTFEWHWTAWRLFLEKLFTVWIVHWLPPATCCEVPWVKCLRLALASQIINHKSKQKKKHKKNGWKTACTVYTKMLSCRNTLWLSLGSVGGFFPRSSFFSPVIHHKIFAHAGPPTQCFVSVQRPTPDVEPFGQDSKRFGWCNTAHHATNSEARQSRQYFALERFFLRMELGPSARWKKKRWTVWSSSRCEH